ncbi:PEPxxWA-CTERM sorting domain-containing protein [Sphingomonas sp. JC676]|uniref:PEPxxWA-CTERM sorting domain-containing protein n=1 Tax=Sphingomonas sp. JC676 TaxID=2768065 RepID=UPI00223BB56C|nr:PEPxxWA-CTERM sorting domain-containing protein [Sphingomonas sp. JC676]
MSKKIAFAVVAALTVAAPASAQNLVTNGSFESGFGGWLLGNVGGGTAPVVIPYGSPSGYPGGAFGEPIGPNAVMTLSPDPTGANVAYFSSDTANPDSLTQTINLVAGTTYNIGFDYYAPANGIANPNDATLAFLINGLSVGSTLTAGSGAGTPAQTWFNFNTSFVAMASGPASLTFEFRGLGVTAADFAIDRVYAIAAVPEPAAWGMMIGGFGMAGMAVRRRRPSKVAYAA